MNIAYLIGRITREPELQGSGGKKNSHITIAVKRPFKGPDGKYATDFITFTVWNVLAEKICTYCKIGDLISVKARIQNNNYTDKNDNKVYSYELIAEQISFLHSSKKNNDSEDEEESNDLEEDE